MSSCSSDNFKDNALCLSLINELNTSVPDHGPIDEDHKIRSESERLVDSFKKTIDKYQEQPELLEAHLEGFVGELVRHLNDGPSKLHEGGYRYHTIFKFLYQLIKVIGFKSIGRRLPHQTDKLPLLIGLLEKEDPQDRLNWQTRYVLLVWLSIVILNPFDLSRFDSGPTSLKMSDRIYSTLTKSLYNYDSCQHVTAYCLARLFSRPDMLKDDKNLRQLVNFAMQEVANVKTVACSTDDIKLIGYLRTLAYFFKFALRAELKDRATDILGPLLKLEIETINRELVNHLVIKLVQRIGVALLPKRTATWSYKRGSRILGQTTIPANSSNIGNNETKPVREHLVKTDISQSDKDQDVDGDAEEEKVAGEIESILGFLFAAAQNGQTKVRWSAAKGIARLTGRLSKERASDVIGTVFGNYFDPITSSEFAWHGGCLTLAEMARQGLIMESKLSAILEVLGRAIIYDKIKGTFAVGAHVRESACYALWAISRTYEDHLLAPYIQSISINLLCAMLFDRETHCRRAASATFQELVGRQGTFNMEGISILTQVDYQSVGVRQFAYLELATQVAKFGNKYSEPFLKHLIEKKLGHWDIQIRRLASDSMSALMLFVDKSFVATNVMPQLEEMCRQNEDNNSKHGAILGLAKVIQSLAPLNYNFEKEQIDLVGSLANLSAKQLKSKQQAPNFIEAISNLIIGAEVARFSYPEDTLKQWEALIFQALDSDNADLREVASNALLSLYRYFYARNKTNQDRVITLLNKSLQSQNESTRCGCLRALSKLGLTLTDSLSQGSDEMTSSCRAERLNINFKQASGEIKVDSDTPDIILMSLISYIGKSTREKSSDLVFAQAKAEACRALVSFIESLDKSRLIISSKWLRASFDVLLEKTEDYTFDKRGDIGVLVRRAAVRALMDLTLFLLSIGMSSVLLNGDSHSTQLRDQEQHQYGNRLNKIISKVIQQAVSYNNSAREEAALAFYRLIQAVVQYELTIPHLDTILELFERFKVTVSDQAGSMAATNGETFNWRDESTPIFVNLLSKEEYGPDLWIGLLPAVGQPSDLCAKQFRDALSDYLQSLEVKQKERDRVHEALLAVLERPDVDGRLVGKVLIVADYLLTEGLLASASEQFQSRLAQLCWQARGQGDPKRLISVCQVLCSMLQFTGQTQIDCLRYCVELLASGFSKVRIFAAGQLYTSIMTYQSDLEENLATVLSTEAAETSSDATEEAIDGGQSAPAATAAGGAPEAVVAEGGKTGKQLDLNGAMDLLSQTNWSEPLDKVKPIRDQVCACLLQL